MFVYGMSDSQNRKGEGKISDVVWMWKEEGNERVRTKGTYSLYVYFSCLIAFQTNDASITFESQPRSAAVDHAFDVVPILDAIYG